jgi:hypothetical protein
MIDGLAAIARNRVSNLPTGKRGADEIRSALCMRHGGEAAKVPGETGRRSEKAALGAHSLPGLTAGYVDSKPIA